MPYTVELKPSAAKSLAALPRIEQRRVAARLDRLAVQPRSQGVEKLAGPDDLYRVRVGDYRIIFQIFDDRLVVLVVRIAHRSEVYR